MSANSCAMYESLQFLMTIYFPFIDVADQQVHIKSVLKS